MSWVWPEYINRDLPLSRQQRKAIHRDAWRLWWANRWNVALYLAVPTVYLLAVSFAGDVGSRAASFVGVRGWGQGVCRVGAPVALFVLCFVGGGAILQRCRFAPCVHRATRQNGYDVCHACGYWLAGLTSKTRRCPECGTEREPSDDARINSA